MLKSRPNTVAPLVEHSTDNPKGEGSNPSASVTWCKWRKYNNVKRDVKNDYITLTQYRLASCGMSVVSSSMRKKCGLQICKT